MLPSNDYHGIHIFSNCLRFYLSFFGCITDRIKNIYIITFFLNNFN